MIVDMSQIATALVISAAVSVGASLMKQDTQERLLEDNIFVTKQLAQKVDNLNVTIAVFQEKYVTKDELDKKIKERKDEPRNR